MDQIIIVMKNWFDNIYFNWKLNINLKQILKSKNMFDKKNYDLIEEHNFFEKL
jgi:hypothetical protein